MKTLKQILNILFTTTTCLGKLRFHNKACMLNIRSTEISIINLWGSIAVRSVPIEDNTLHVISILTNMLAGNSHHVEYGCHLDAKYKPHDMCSYINILRR